MAAILGGLLVTPAPAGSEKKPQASSPGLTEEHRTASGRVSFRTPSSWTVTTAGGQPEVTEARGDALLLRLLWRDGELGLDSLHVECMQARLRAPMDTFPQVDYEYDFVGGTVGERRALDSAFVVHYDDPVEGHRDWRQRNLTLVGEGESLCVIAYAPQPVWKKSKPARKLLTSVVESIRF